MNAVAKQTPVDQFRKQITSLGPELANALPSHIKPERFQRVVMTVVQQTPDLLDADRRSLLGACMKCAADGLIPDGREAALVIFNTKTKDNGWEKRVQYMPMLAGLLKRARNSGEIASITVQTIQRNDKFIWRPSEERAIEHEVADFTSERGEMIGAYAIVRLKDGSIMSEVMPKAAIDKIRSVSRSKDRGPWVDWYEEMARKTVFRRLSKWLPMDAETERLIRHDEAVSAGQTIDGEAVEADEPMPQISAPASKLDVLEGEIVNASDEELATLGQDA